MQYITCLQESTLAKKEYYKDYELAPTHCPLCGGEIYYGSEDSPKHVNAFLCLECDCEFSFSGGGDRQRSAFLRAMQQRPTCKATPQNPSLQTLKTNCIEICRIASIVWIVMAVITSIAVLFYRIYSGYWWLLGMVAIFLIALMPMSNDE